MPELLTTESLVGWRKRHAEGIVVVTNGCFDILHLGHLHYLRQAKREGDALLVGLNSDASVRALKGEGRPVNPQTDRAEMLIGLRCVDAVCVFEEVRCVGFLESARPDVYCKGGDYCLETLDPSEREVLERIGARIVFIPVVPGRSTTSVLQAASAAGPRRT